MLRRDEKAGRHEGSVTIKHIATVLGKAHSTVSRALNDHPHISGRTKSEVRRVAAELGYVANSGARLMRSGESHLVGLIVPDIQNDFYSTAAKIVAERCAASNYQLVLAVSEDDPAIEHQHVRALREIRAAAVVITATAAPRHQTLALLSEMPTIQFLRRHPKIHGHFVGIDDEHGIFEATAHLLAAGHRDIAFIGNSSAVSTGAGRLAGFHAAMAQAGLAVDPRRVLLGKPRPSFGREAVNLILARPSPPTALVLSSSELVTGAVDAIQSARLTIPGDFSIVGYGDPAWFRIWRPGVTTVGLPITEIAITTASFLFRAIRQSASDDEARSTISLRPTLVLRGSTGRSSLAAGRAQTNHPA